MYLSRFATGCVAALVVVLLGSCAPSQERYHADYPNYGSLRELHEKADLVVRVRLDTPSQAKRITTTKSGNPEQNPNAGTGQDGSQQQQQGPVVTVFPARVQEVFKGDVQPGQRIEVKQLGGEYQGTTYTAAGTVPLRGDNDVLLFLKAYPDSPASLLNPVQGQYPIGQHGQPTSLNGNPLSFNTAELTALGNG